MSSKEKKLKAAKRIIENADLYKICECCESIVLYVSVFCPLCDGYRFNDDITSIQKLALKLVEKEKTDILPSDLI